MKATMRILLVGNYPLGHQASMLRYASMLCEQLALHGHQTEIIQPQPIVGNRIVKSNLRKWLGYIDKYVLLPAKLLHVRRPSILYMCATTPIQSICHTGVVVAVLPAMI